MDMQTRITDAMKSAMKSKEATRLSTLRLINAAIKDQAIAMRGAGNPNGPQDSDILAILGKMVKQRNESARTYEEGGRLELAEKEREEISIIESFLPRKMSEDEVAKAITEAVTTSGADSIRDMGKVMGVLKSKYTGRMDFGVVGPMVKNQLSASA